jgi:uncharacterized membrane protein
MRELAAGVGILSQPMPAAWIWSRVAGDALDLASLGSALSSSRADRTKVMTATVAVLGVTALDMICAQQLSNEADGSAQHRPVRFTQSIIINRSPDEIYEFWQNPQNLPKFIERLESVESRGDGRYLWITRGPGGNTMEWTAEKVEDMPGHAIGWRFATAAGIAITCSVHFERATGNRGTVVRAELRGEPRGGAIGATLAKLVGAGLELRLEQDLRRLKQILETGEVVQSDASIHPGMHPARPPEGQEQQRTVSNRRSQGFRIPMPV